MKSKMRITGNRTVIGIICIVLALGITFGIAPLVNRFTDRKVEVVQVKQNVERGHLITEDDVELVKVGALNLSDRTVKNKKYVVGKYAATNLYAGQIMIADLVAEKSNSADDVLSALDGTKVAISVNIASFAQGLSNKLRNGDIVSVIVYDKETNQSHVPPELRYVKVITTTTGDSVDSDRKTDATQAITVTLLASPDQANEYAGNAVENTERRTARNVAYGAGKIGNWGLKETRKNILKWRNRQKKFIVKVQQPKQLPAHKRPALPPAKTTAKTAQKGVKTAQQTAKATAKTAKVTVKAAQRAAQAATRGEDCEVPLSRLNFPASIPQPRTAYPGAATS